MSPPDSLAMRASISRHPVIGELDTAAAPATPAAAAVPRATQQPAPGTASCSLAFGMYQHDAPWSWQTLDALEAQLNRHLAIVHWYSQWGNQSGDFNATVRGLLQATRRHGSTPLITWEPWNTYPISNNPFPLAQIAAGAYDNYVDQWAVGLAAYGHPVMLAFAHEMNGNWYPWGNGVNGSTATAYVAAWRHLHDRFASKGARNVQWVFDPDGDMFGSYPDLRLFYPGDPYVDWLGVDVYNWGTTQGWSAWQPFSAVLRLSYARLSSLSSSKPLMLVEVASAEQGGNKADWISSLRRIPVEFPRLRAVVWFAEPNSGLALTSSASALAAARAVFGSPPFCSTLAY